MLRFAPPSVSAAAFAASLAALVTLSCAGPSAPTSSQPPPPPAAPTAPLPATGTAPPLEPAPPGADTPPATPVPSAPTGPGRVATGTFRSEALGVDKAYQVYLPGGYDSSVRRYPVVYLLHGYGGDETNWVRAGDLAQAADAIELQAIVVMPDGDDSFYSSWVTPLPFEACQKSRPAAFGRTESANTYCVRRHDYESYIVKDLVAHVDGALRTLTNRRARAILGLSMGGFGALALAMRHTDVYAVAGSHSGVVAPLYDGPHPYVAGQAKLRTTGGLDPKYPQDLRDQAIRVLGADVANWRAHDPSALAAGLQPDTLAIYLDCGTEDGFKLADQASYLHDVLTRAGVRHTFELAPGDHSFTFWKARIRKSLTFAAAALAKPSP